MKTMRIGLAFAMALGVGRGRRRSHRSPGRRQGRRQVQMPLGDLYNEGLGVPEREDDAIYWWNRAAEAGDAEAVQAMSEVRAGNHAIGRAPTEGVAEVANASGRRK